MDLHCPYFIVTLPWASNNNNNSQFNRKKEIVLIFMNDQQINRSLVKSTANNDSRKMSA